MSESTNIEINDGIKDHKNNPPAYFNALYYGLIIWGVVFSAYFILTGWSSHKEFEQKMTVYEQTYSTNGGSGARY